MLVIKLMIKRIILIFYFLFIAFLLYPQKNPPNLPYFEDTPVHFGWFVGVNQLYSNAVPQGDFPVHDSIMGFQAESNLGFNIGVLTDFRVCSFIHFRLLPGVVFSQRNLIFNIDNNDRIQKRVNSLEVIYAELPAEIKIMSKRWHNFRPYLISGVKYDYDLGSIKRKKISNSEFLFKVNDAEFLYTVGVGFDFYFQFFKLSLEIKNSFGIIDVMNHDFVTPYSDCIRKLKTQMFYINFIFQ